MVDCRGLRPIPRGDSSDTYGVLPTSQASSCAAVQQSPPPPTAAHRPCRHRGGGLLLTAPKGGPPRLRNWCREVFDSAVRAAGLSALTPHDLRNTAAWLAVVSGATVGRPADARPRLGGHDPGRLLRPHRRLSRRSGRADGRGGAG